jgi:hypothetical protein
MLYPHDSGLVEVEGTEVYREYRSHYATQWEDSFFLLDIAWDVPADWPMKPLAPRPWWARLLWGVGPTQEPAESRQARRPYHCLLAKERIEVTLEDAR